MIKSNIWKSLVILFLLLPVTFLGCGGGGGDGDDAPVAPGTPETTPINVRINQVETNCPGTEFTAYVSVTDQENHTVTGLTANNFKITETGGYVGPPTTSSYVSNTGDTIAVALVMDYSSSINEGAREDMEESVAGFVNQLGDDDEAEIIKYADDFDVVQSWQPGTDAGKDFLEAAIYAPYNNGGATLLYDTVMKAVDDTASKLSKDRRAVIVITDGFHDDGSDSGIEFSNYDLNDVIDNANDKGVPIFAVGLGWLDLTVLDAMADGTGGQVYKSTTSEDLITIYQQLADLLYADQYVLTYLTALGLGDTANLTIDVTSGALSGNYTKEIASCP